MKRLGETSFRGKRQSREEGGRVLSRGEWMFFGSAPDIKSAGVLGILFQWASIDQERKHDLSHPVFFEKEQICDSAAHQVNRMSNFPLSSIVEMGSRNYRVHGHQVSDLGWADSGFTRSILCQVLLRLMGRLAEEAEQ